MVNRDECFFEFNTLFSKDHIRISPENHIAVFEWIEFTKEDRGLDVEKLLLETIGGALFIKTDKTYTDAAEKTSKWTIAAALKSSTTEMIVTAQDKIELVCGNSSVTLLPESVEIKADALDLSKAEVFEAEAPLVENNC